MITIVMSRRIRAGTDRVWRALTLPDEVARWDPNIVAAIDAPPDYPKPGQHVRWRYRLHGVPLILHDRPLEVIARERLRSAISLGLFRFDETYTLRPEKNDAAHTRLGMKLIASNAVPVVGGVLDRFGVRGLATQIVATSLESIQRFCESSA